MRDPNRIPEIIVELQKAWLKCPDLRLGQLICSASYLVDKNQKDDPFYVEDDKMLEGIKQLQEKP